MCNSRVDRTLGSTRMVSSDSQNLLYPSIKHEITYKSLLKTPMSESLHKILRSTAIMLLLLESVLCSGSGSSEVYQEETQ